MSRRVRHAGGLDPDTAARVDVVLRAMQHRRRDRRRVQLGARTQPMGFTSTALERE